MEVKIMGNSLANIVQAHPRLFCWLLALLGASLTLYEWHAIRREHFYSPTASVIGPLCVVLFGTFGLLPSDSAKAAQGKTRKIIAAMTVFGLALGLLNLYAMTHS